MENEETRRFKIVCSWCNRVIQNGSGTTSHGMCVVCRDRLFPNLPSTKRYRESKENRKE